MFLYCFVEWDEPVNKSEQKSGYDTLSGIGRNRIGTPSKAKRKKKGIFLAPLIRIYNLEKKAPTIKAKNGNGGERQRPQGSGSRASFRWTPWSTYQRLGG